MLTFCRVQNLSKLRHVFCPFFNFLLKLETIFHLLGSFDDKNNLLDPVGSLRLFAIVILNSELNLEGATNGQIGSVAVLM